MRRAMKLLLLGILPILLLGLAMPVFARDDKSLFTSSDPREIYSAGVVSTMDKTAYSGACTVYGITFSNGATAADYVSIYDETSSTGTPKFCLSIDTAKDTVSANIPSDGISFDNGITHRGSADGGFITIIYE